MDRQARVDLEDAVESAVLCWLATINDDGGPSVSPKEIFTLCGPQSLAIADIASSNSVWNIRARPRVCVSLIDVFRQRGAQLYGDARIAGRGDADYAAHAPKLSDMAGDAFVIRNVMVVAITRTAQIVAPSYWAKPGTTEADMVASAHRAYGVQPRADGDG